MRSQIISAPVQVAERFCTASQMAFIAGVHISSLSPLSEDGIKLRSESLARPIFSIILRSSGWKSITSASRPHWKQLFSRNLIVCKLKIMEIT